MEGFARVLAFVVAWWLVLLGWWVLLVGTNAGIELVAGACAAALGAALAAGLRRRRLLAFRFEAPWLTKTLRVPWHVAREFTVVAWALALHLARVRPVRSTYRAFAFPAGRVDPVSRGRRALVTAADAVSPNTIPVDMDCERDLLLRHELDPRRTTNDPP
jgi:hypothetical protein